MAKTQLKDVIVVLPGIMGSVLQKDGKDLWAISGQAAWGALKSRGGSFQELILNGDDPEAEYLDDGIKATRLIEDVHGIPGFFWIDGYTKTKKIITDNFEVIPGDIRENKSANFFEFPYDWRRDTRINAKILQRHLEPRLHQWRENTGFKDAKVIFLAHSLGGLVCRYYLEVLEGWSTTKALFTFGTPYHGSPKALGYLANGYKSIIGDFTDIVRSLPAAYQLLPTYPMINVDGKDYLIAESPSDLPNIKKSLAVDALKFHTEIKDAVDNHRKDNEYLLNGYKIIPFVGTDQPTLQSARFINGKVETSNELPIGLDSLLIHGDGTVPYLSAVPIELANDFRESYLPEQHGSLQNHPKVLGELRDRIKDAQAKGKGAIRGPEIIENTSKPSAISLTLDDLYLADETIAIQVQLLNFNQDPRGVKANITSVSGGTSLERDFQEQGDDWKLELGSVDVSSQP